MRSIRISNASNPLGNKHVPDNAEKDTIFGKNWRKKPKIAKFSQLRLRAHILHIFFRRLLVRTQYTIHILRLAFEFYNWKAARMGKRLFLSQAKTRTWTFLRQSEKKDVFLINFRGQENMLPKSVNMKLYFQSPARWVWNKKFTILILVLFYIDNKFVIQQNFNLSLNNIIYFFTWIRN